MRLHRSLMTFALATLAASAFFLAWALAHHHVLPADLPYVLGPLAVLVGAPWIATVARRAGNLVLANVVLVVAMLPVGLLGWLVGILMFVPASPHH